MQKCRRGHTLTADNIKLNGERSQCRICWDKARKRRRAIGRDNKIINEVANVPFWDLAPFCTRCGTPIVDDNDGLYRNRHDSELHNCKGVLRKRGNRFVRKCMKGGVISELYEEKPSC